MGQTNIDTVTVSKTIAVITALIISGISSFSGYTINAQSTVAVTKAEVAEIISEKVNNKLDDLAEKSATLNTTISITNTELKNLRREVEQLKQYHSMRGGGY